MEGKNHVILYTVLSAALLVAVFVGVRAGLREEKANRALEEGYTQRLLETQEHLQAIGVNLVKIPAAEDHKTLVELLSGASKQADGVVTGLSALPLSHAAMSETMKFCNQLSEYLMTLALAAASGQELSPQDAALLSQMESQCALLLGAFAVAKEEMVQNSLLLATNQSVFYQEPVQAERPLELVGDEDNGMEYPSMIYDGAFSDARHYGTPKALGDARVNAAQAAEIAREYVGKERVKEAAQGAETAGTLAAYGVTLTLKDGTVLNAEVTKQGGKLLWIVPEHASFAPALGLEECREKAGAFLQARGYGDMEANHYQVYDGLAVFNFVALQDGVLLYPDLVKVQVRMDTGEVVGMEANNYLMNHERRAALTPALTGEDAVGRVSAKLNAKSARLCVIPYKDRERLCYEVPGSYNGQEYRVYIDAATGEEAKVLVLLKTTDGQMSAEGRSIHGMG